MALIRQKHQKAVQRTKELKLYLQMQQFRLSFSSLNSEKQESLSLYKDEHGKY